MKVNAKRLWERLQEVGSIGADPRGGISRFAWTPEYRQACELLMQWMREAGLTVRMDTVGNIFGRLEGKTSKPAILSGSHFDTVPCGGKFDGLAGIMTALEALKTGLRPSVPLKWWPLLMRRPASSWAVLLAARRCVVSCQTTILGNASIATRVKRCIRQCWILAWG